MAKSKETFNKKEKEKKRQAQKKEKHARMEERKATKKKGVPLQDMMAYLDENGNLSDTPPDTRNRREVTLEEIQISVPRKTDEPDVPHEGIVHFFDSGKGFGFINEVGTNQRIFFHVSDLLDPIDEKDKVVFRKVQDVRGPGAKEVKKLT